MNTTTQKNMNLVVPGSATPVAEATTVYKQDNLLKEKSRNLDPRIAAARARAEQINKAAEPIKEIVPEVTLEEEQEYNKLHPLSEQVDKPVNVDVDKIQNVNIKLNKIQEQALKLLGQGLKPALVAQVLSVDPSRISQLMEDPNFSRMVTERKIVSLTAATERDEELDKLEDKLIAKMHTAIDMTYKPSEITRMFTAINQAKRRGVAATDEVDTGGVTTVKLILPAAARTRMQVGIEINDNNQVVSVGTGDSSQQLGAINPKHLMDIYKDSKVIDGRVVRGNKEEIEDANFTEVNAATLSKINNRARSQANKLQELDGTDASNINLDEL